jgi:hypothetical protein
MECRNDIENVANIGAELKEWIMSQIYDSATPSLPGLDVWPHEEPEVGGS